MPNKEKHVRYEQSWHLDKRVPIALILAIGMQTFMGVWFLSALDQRVLSLEQTRTSQNTLPDRVTKLEVLVELIPKALDRIEERQEENRRIVSDLRSVADEIARQHKEFLVSKKERK